MQLSTVFKRVHTLPFDERSLGAFRIGLGITLFINLYVHLSQGGLEAFYTSQGVVPTALLTNPHRWSFLDQFQTVPLVTAAFVIVGLVYLSLTVGLLTRVTKWLSFLCLVSIYHRNPYVDEAPDFALRLFSLWACFLPLGRRFSLDSAFLKKIPLLQEGESCVAQIGLCVNMSLIYLLNVIQKSGDAWRSGEAVNRILWDHLATPLGVAARGGILCATSSFLSWSVLAVELVASLTILLSVWSLSARRFAAATIIFLHTSFALILFLGSFIPLYLSLALLFIPGQDWTRLRVFERQSVGPNKHFVYEVLGCLMIIWVLLMIAADNPRIPATIKWAAEKLTPSYAYRMKDMTMIPQEWFLFADPSATIFIPIVEARTPEGRTVNPIIGTVLDAPESLIESAAFSKAWMSFLIRLARPSSALLRKHFAEYIFRKGYTQLDVSNGFLTIPKGCGVVGGDFRKDRLFSASRPISAPFAVSQGPTRSGMVRVVVQDMSSFNSGLWPGGVNIFAEYGGIGASADFRFRMPKSCEGRPILHITRASDYGEFIIQVNASSSTVVDFFSPWGVFPDTVPLPSARLVEGDNTLTVTFTGRVDPLARNRMGLSAVEVTCK